MNPVLIVVALMPQMLAEIVLGVLSSQSDMRVLGPVFSDAELMPLIDRTEPAAVILGHNDSTLPEIARRILLSHPSLTVLSISGGGDRGWIHRLIPSCEPVTELSPESLVETLRSSVHLLAGRDA